MDYTDKFYQKKTGAFYTPKIWADKAVDYIRRWLGEDAFKDYLFYDPAAGEGALLDSLPLGCNTFASTLEHEDVEILTGKGYAAIQLDVLNEAMPWPLQCANNLIVLMNPPYFKSKINDSAAGLYYKTNDSVALFYYRIFKELSPRFVFSFNKIDLFSSKQMRRLKADLKLPQTFMGGFLSNSKIWGLKGEFPIAFCGYDLAANYPVSDHVLFDVFGHEKKLKKVYLY